MISRRSSRYLLQSVRWTMIFSGVVPFAILMMAPNALSLALANQFALPVVFGLYCFIGLFWSAMEKENVDNRKHERLVLSVFRVLLVLMFLTVVPAFVSMNAALTLSISTAIHKANAKAAEPELITIMRIWPAMWAIICAYSLKPVWDHAVNAVRGKLVAPTFDLRLPEKPIKSLKISKPSTPAEEITATSVAAADMIQAS